MTHYGGCAILFNRDTFCSDIKVTSIYLHDLRGCQQDNVKEGESGCVLQGVISRASFRRQPRGGKSFFTVMSWHININYAKERGIGKKLLLTIRAVMPEEHVDLVAGDFNGAAWRRQCGNGRLSIIEEAFADTDLPMPQGQYQVNGPTYEDFPSLLTLMKDGKWHSMVHSPFLTIPWASVQRIKSCHHEVWLRLAFVNHHGDYEPRRRHELKERSAPYQPNKEKGKAVEDESDGSLSS